MCTHVADGSYDKTIRCVRKSLCALPLCYIDSVRLFQALNSPVVLISIVLKLENDGIAQEKLEQSPRDKFLWGIIFLGLLTVAIGEGRWITASGLVLDIICYC